LETIPPFIASVSAILVALVTGVFTWLATHKKSPQETINLSFQAFIDQMQEERTEMRKENSFMLSELKAMRSDIYQLEEHINKLEALLREHNIKFDHLVQRH
jgi:uncharacterized membrane protein (DUF106 family)